MPDLPSYIWRLAEDMFRNGKSPREIAEHIHTHEGRDITHQAIRKHMKNKGIVKSEAIPKPKAVIPSEQTVTILEKVLAELLVDAIYLFMSKEKENERAGRKNLLDPIRMQRLQRLHNVFRLLRTEEHRRFAWHLLKDYPEPAEGEHKFDADTAVQSLFHG